MIYLLKLFKFTFIFENFLGAEKLRNNNNCLKL